MKVLLVAACAVTCARAVAVEWEPDQLPRPIFADTEVTTNCPFAIPYHVHDFRFSVAFTATPSNNVQLAFGTDSDTNGVLSAEETGMRIGWDCGCWRVESPQADEVLVGEAVTPEARKVLSWDLSVRRGEPRQLVLAENGEAIFENLTNSLPWFVSREWNLVRLTVRGVDDPEEIVSLEATERGTAFILR